MGTKKTEKIDKAVNPPDEAKAPAKAPANDDTRVKLEKIEKALFKHFGITLAVMLVAMTALLGVVPNASALSRISSTNVAWVVTDMKGTNVLMDVDKQGNVRVAGSSTVGSAASASAVYGKGTILTNLAVGGSLSVSNSITVATNLTVGASASIGNGLTVNTNLSAKTLTITGAAGAATQTVITATMPITVNGTNYHLKLYLNTGE